MTSPIYLITYDYFDRKLDRRFSGIHDFDNQTREGAANEIASDYVTGVQRIYECIPGGSCTDITTEIAEAVAGILHDEQEPLSYAIANWLHNHHPAGVMSTRGLIGAA